MKIRPSILILSSALFFLLGAMFNGLFAIGMLIDGGTPDPVVFLRMLAAWAFYGLLTPFLIPLLPSFPIQSRRWGRIALVICSASFLIAFGSELLLPTGMIAGEEQTAVAAEGFRSFRERVLFALGDGLTIKLILSSLLLFAVAVARQRRGSAAAARSAAELGQRLERARLEVLRNRLDPHFLFNALNSIASLVRSDPSVARGMLRDLHGLVEQSLKRGIAQDIPLEEELRFIRHYVAIEQKRLGDRLRVRWSIGDDSSLARIPSLLLQPLVENAIRHGIATSIDGGSVTIRAEKCGSALELEVSDDGAGSRGNGKRGMGLSTTIERLERMYGEKHSFVINASDRGFRVAISIPFMTLPFAAPGGAS
jgi:hypothetical protein